MNSNASSSNFDFSFRKPRAAKTRSKQCLDSKLPLTIWVWKKFIEKTLRIYPNGICRFAVMKQGNGKGKRKWLPYSPTFTLLKLKTEELEMLRDEKGRLKEPWLTKLAYLVANTETKQILSEFDLVGVALHELILRYKKRRSRVNWVEIAPNIRLRSH